MPWWGTFAPWRNSTSPLWPLFSNQVPGKMAASCGLWGVSHAFHIRRQAARTPAKHLSAHHARPGHTPSGVAAENPPGSHRPAATLRRCRSSPSSWTHTFDGLNAFNRQGEPTMQRTIALSAARLSPPLMLSIPIHGTTPATAGESTPNVTGKWQGSYNFRGGRMGSGEITFDLAQQGNTVTGRQSLVDLQPAWGPESGASTIPVQPDIRDGEMMGSTLHFHVPAENISGHLNFTLTVSGNTMTGTMCANYCANLQLKKAAF